MPIEIEISVNGWPQRSLHIGRTEDFKGMDQEHLYLVTGSSDSNHNPNWEEGLSFTHVYADGLLTCVRKGVQRFEEEYIS